MRLEPIEKPRGLQARLAFWLSRRQFGRVVSPIRVMYTRAPRLGRLAYSISQTIEKGLSLDPELTLLVVSQSSLINGCAFCADLHRAQAVRAKLGSGKLDQLFDFESSPLFDERDRAALAYTAEITRDRKAADATFERLRRHFDEREIVEITWLNAVGNYFNLMALPLELEPDGLLELAQRAA